MSDRKRIYAIHILDATAIAYPEIPFGSGQVYIYRKTRDERITQKSYITRRADRLTHALIDAGYEAAPFMEYFFIEGVLPYTLDHRQIGVKFEIPGRYDSLDSFDELEPSAYARESYQERAIRQAIIALNSVYDGWASDYGIDLDGEMALEDIATDEQLADLIERVEDFKSGANGHA